MTFDAWKKKTAEYAAKEIDAGDLFDDWDPYDLTDDCDPRVSYERGESPEDYVRRVFAEDLAAASNDAELARQASEEGESEND